MKYIAYVIVLIVLSQQQCNAADNKASHKSLEKCHIENPFDQSKNGNVNTNILITCSIN